MLLAQITVGCQRAQRLLDRSTSFAVGVDAKVQDIVAAVRSRGDAALIEYTQLFDQRAPHAGSYEIDRGRWDAAAATVAAPVRAALQRASARIAAFHQHQLETDIVQETDGIRLELRSTPLARVGIYVPGGTARYPSSVLMTAIPAQVAGVDEIIMVTPGASAETLCAAQLAGVHRVFEIGGAQAVAALAYGTATVPRVDKIVGPGNQWVASAKRQVYGAVDIDSIAGPSEVLIIADDTAPAAWIAADLLAQAEHDTEARAILVTTSRVLADAVEVALVAQLSTLPRRAIAEAALRDYGAAVIVESLDQAVAFANQYAPEHLELQVREPRAIAALIRTAGAIFVGAFTSEAAGDYIAGSNHVLPTGGAGRYASPLGVYDFQKRTSWIEYTQAAAVADAADIAALAEVEGLHAHGRSALLRTTAPTLLTQSADDTDPVNPLTQRKANRE